MLIFIIISETSSAEDRNSASTRSGFTAWCRDSPLAITVCVHSKLAAWDGIAQSVQRIATAWMVRGSNPDGDKIFCTRPDRPWGPPNLLYKGYKVYFLGLKYWRRGVQHPTQSNAEVKGRVETHTHTHTHGRTPLPSEEFVVAQRLLPNKTSTPERRPLKPSLPASQRPQTRWNRRSRAAVCCD